MKTEVEVKIPMIPNFILVGNESISIAHFTDKQLREIGKEWTEKLIEHAKSKRQ